MALTAEEIKELKEQLYSQTEHLPEDKKALAKKQIDEMSAETLEYLLKQSQTQSKKEKGIFRMIVDKEADALEVGENKKAIAVLDINPISKGHTIVIPKAAVKNSKNMPNNVFTLAKAMAKHIIKNLGAKSADIHSENKFNEVIVYVIPIYDSPLHLGSPRQKVPREELEAIASKIRIKKRQRVQKIKISSQSSAPAQILKRRIP